jgi:hypothetical protein
MGPTTPKRQGPRSLTCRRGLGTLARSRDQRDSGGNAAMTSKTTCIERPPGLPRGLAKWVHGDRPTLWCERWPQTRIAVMLSLTRPVQEALLC